MSFISDKPTYDHNDDITFTFVIPLASQHEQYIPAILNNKTHLWEPLPVTSQSINGNQFTFTVTSPNTDGTFMYGIAQIAENNIHNIIETCNVKVSSKWLYYTGIGISAISILAATITSSSWMYTKAEEMYYGKDDMEVIAKRKLRDSKRK